MQSLITSLRSTGILTIALTFALGANFAYGQWVNPSTNPPGGNIAAPVNVGSTAQIKQGVLGVDSLTTFGWNYIESTGPTTVYTDTSDRAAQPAARNFLQHVNNGSMHFIADRNDDGSIAGEWPYALSLSSRGTVGGEFARFSNQVLAKSYCNRDGTHCLFPELNGVDMTNTDGGDISTGADAAGVSVQEFQFVKNGGGVESYTMGDASEWDACFLSGNTNVRDSTSFSSDDVWLGGCVVDTPGFQGDDWGMRAFSSADNNNFDQYCFATCMKFGGEVDNLGTQINSFAWESGEWGECIETESILNYGVNTNSCVYFGDQTRTIQCVDRGAGGAVVANSNCTGNPPRISKSCTGMNIDMCRDGEGGVSDSGVDFSDNANGGVGQLY